MKNDFTTLNLSCISFSLQLRKWFRGKKKKLLLEISKEPEERTWSFSSNDGHHASLSVLFRAHVISSIQFSCSVVSDSLWPHEPKHASFPVHHQLLESTQTHVHWVGDAIQPSHPLPSPSPPALNLSQHQGLFKWVSSLYQVAKVLEFQLQHQSFQWTLRTLRTDLL